MKLKALCFVALAFAMVLISSAATKTSKDEKKSEAVAAEQSQDQARGGNLKEGKYYRDCCRYCPKVGKDAKEAETVMEKNEGPEYWGGGGGGGHGGGWGGGGGGHGGGGHGGGGHGGGKCPHCTAAEAEAQERASRGKPQT